MAATFKDNPLYLRVTLEPAEYSTDHLYLRGRLTYWGSTWTDRPPQWLNLNDRDYAPLCLERLEIEASAAESMRDSGFYGWTLAYMHPYQVDVGSAEAMARTLQKIHHKREILAKAWGSPQDAGTWVLHVAKAIGCRGILLASPWERDEKRELVDGVSYIRHLERMWKDANDELYERAEYTGAKRKNTLGVGYR